jgi:hypothetical protein
MKANVPASRYYLYNNLLGNLWYTFLRILRISRLSPLEDEVFFRKRP